MLLKVYIICHKKKFEILESLRGKDILCLILSGRAYTTHKYRSKYDVGKLILMDEVA